MTGITRAAPGQELPHVVEQEALAELGRKLHRRRHVGKQAVKLRRESRQLRGRPADDVAECRCGQQPGGIFEHFDVRARAEPCLPVRCSVRPTSGTRVRALRPAPLRPGGSCRRRPRPDEKQASSSCGGLPDASHQLRKFGFPADELAPAALCAARATGGRASAAAGASAPDRRRSSRRTSPNDWIPRRRILRQHPGDDRGDRLRHRRNLLVQICRARGTVSR